jgi:hypothetical protein
VFQRSAAAFCTQASGVNESGHIFVPFITFPYIFFAKGNGAQIELPHHAWEAGKMYAEAEGRVGASV